MSFPTRASLALATVAFVATLAPPLAAQRDVQAPGTYAITNARLVPVSSAPIERGTIVIRNGLIVAVGANVTAPADARVVDGTGLTVYPGLIDAYSTLGLRTQAAPGGGGGGGGGGFGGGAAPTRPAGAPNSTMPIGLQPEVRAVDQLTDDADYAAAYAAGLTVALTAPSGRTYEGQSALITLSGSDFSESAIRPTVALHVGFQGIGGGQYPGSLLGVMAALRQSLIDAQQYRDAQAAYTRNPRGVRRPAFDPSMDALQPVIAGTMPVVFRASTQREIERALDLAKEFNLRAIIGGGSEAYLVADRLKADNVPVLLSLNFPRRTAPAAGVGAAADAPEPLRVLRGRVQAPKTPGELARAGVRFAFQAGGANYTDFLPNLRRAVEGGLSADQALRAVTLGSAEILGAADRLGSLEVGKIANLTVVRGDLLAADTRVATVYVDGRPHEIPAPANTGGGARPGAGRPGLEGSWAVQIALEGAERYATVVLRQDNDRLVGTLEGDLGAAEILDVQFESDGTVSFTTSVTLPEGTEEARFTGRLDGGIFSGRVEIVGHDAGRFAGLRATTTTDRARERSFEER